MCAIAGIIDFDGREGQTGGEQLLNTVFHREQGQRGVYRRGPAWLFHTRPLLARPENGRQPVVLSARGGLALVYSGRLDNGETLREELTGLGHCFEGGSEGETAAHAYAEWGAECVKRFEGSFALAVWEEEGQRLFLARDRMGAEPLFFSLDGERLRFASEIKTLLEGPAASRHAAGEGAARGEARNIQELEKGSCACWSKTGWRVWRYWEDGGAAGNE